MAFYSSIADAYDDIFPLKTAQVQFVESALRISNAKILDIGSATGSLTLELARRGYVCTAIDFDKEMIKIAGEKALGVDAAPHFLQMDMREIPGYFSETRFDAVICFGNTLVHLTNLSDIRHFLAQTAILLSNGGVLLLQIINYDRILDRGISGLPSIETDRILFERYYEFNGETGLLDFQTILTVKDSGKKIENSLPLYPLRAAELEEMLHPAGFTDIRKFGDFSGGPFSSESVRLIAQAKI